MGTKQKRHRANLGKQTRPTVAVGLIATDNAQKTKKGEQTMQKAKEKKDVKELKVTEAYILARLKNGGVP